MSTDKIEESCWVHVLAIGLATTVGQQGWGRHDGIIFCHRSSGLLIPDENWSSVQENIIYCICHVQECIVYIYTEYQSEGTVNKKNKIQLEDLEQIDWRVLIIYTIQPFLNFKSYVRCFMIDFSYFYFKSIIKI